MSEILHYGTKRHSGRYPWGSGEDPYQSNKHFLSYIKEMRKEGMTDAEIAKGLGMKTQEFRSEITLSTTYNRAADVAQAHKLLDKGYSVTAIGRAMGKNESSIRALLDPAIQERKNKTITTAEVLRDSLKETGMLDIGTGQELFLGVSKTRLDAAVALLKDEGYRVETFYLEQANNKNNYTTMKVLVRDDITRQDMLKNQNQIKTIHKFSEDDGGSFRTIKPPRSVDSKRILIKYKEDGGDEKDGVIEIRRGVEDLSLGDSTYKQVRIAVDDSHYMKGMAYYKDDIPKGYDMVYYTNKPIGTDPYKVYKAMETDGVNEFGSIVRQVYYKDKNGKEQLSAINIMGDKEGSGEEGYWDTWSKTLSSQFLSKQPVPLAKKQLDLAYDQQVDEFNRLSKLTNPVIKQRMLIDFADNADADASHLRAAALPRQRTQVLLPIPSMKDNEVYAPNFRNGEQICLVRFPHAGRFEIPLLTVNNKNREARSIIGNGADAIGINKRVAEILSGADFDGDTVLAIPNPPNVGLKVSAPLKGLENFDAKARYTIPEGDTTTTRMTKKNIGRYMGDVSNLITDMHIKDATDSELARAVRHSMVVIDAYKHGLDYKQSAIDNDIASLKTTYQGGPRSGAATLISRATSDARVDARSRQYDIDPKTGEKMYRKSIRPGYIDQKTGEFVTKKQVSTKMAEVKDAYELSSGTKMEAVYADHANKLKSLANKARLESLTVTKMTTSPSAKTTYAKEVESLKTKLNVALKNAPLERQAQLITKYSVETRVKENPLLDKEAIRKITSQELAKARERTGASKQMVVVTEKEWDAIQAGAVSTSTLQKIVNNSDIDSLKKLATPKESSVLPQAKVGRMKAMLANGYTQSEVADALGVSSSTVAKYT